MDKEDFKTVAEAVALLPFGRDSVYRLINNGTLETVTMGRLRYIKKSSIDAFLKRMYESGGDGNAFKPKSRIQKTVVKKRSAKKRGRSAL